MLPAKLTLPGKGGRALAHRMRRHDRVTVHRFALPRALAGSDALDVRLAFAHGQVEELAARRTRLPPVTLQVTTLQKDNPIEWILDWLAWLGLAGVERVLLYDNASAGADALFGALLDACAGRTLPALVFVDWPYAYGPTRSYYNQFAQATQNNHAHRCLGGAAWTGHFDVDEYPVASAGPDGDPYGGPGGGPSGGPSGGPGTADALRRRVEAAGSRTGLLRLDSHWMPDVREDAPDVLPTVRDFAHRERAARGRAHKYLVRTRALRAANTHNARLRPGWAWRTTATSDACFLHYKALTTRWREYAAREAREPFDPARHVGERRVLDGLGARRAPRGGSG